MNRRKLHLRAAAARRGHAPRRLRLEVLEDRRLLTGLVASSDAELQAALVVADDDFAGPAAGVTTSTPEADLQRGGWQVASATQAPSLSGSGGLVSTAANQFVSLDLPPAGPNSIISIAVALQAPAGNGNWVAFGLTNGVHALTADQSGPWLTFAGNGQMMLYGGSGTQNGFVATASYAGGSVNVELIYDVGNQRATVFVAGAPIYNSEPVTHSLGTPSTEFVTLQFGAAGSTAPFSIDGVTVRTLPRPPPLRELTPQQVFEVTSYGAVPDDAGNDLTGIQAALAAAKSWQSSHGNAPAEVHFQPGTYIFYASGTATTGITLTGYQNLLINGDGAQLQVTNPALGLITFYSAKNVIVRDLSIDYSPWPFVQGTVVAKTGSNKVTVDIDAGSPLPTDAHIAGAPEKWAYFVQPGTPGRLVEDTYWNYTIDAVSTISPTRFSITLHEGYSNIAVGSKYLEVGRYNGAAWFNFWSNCEQLSFINIVGYTGPTAAFVGGGSKAVNFINCQVAIAPGRFKSVDGDGIHTQSMRIGPWIENCLLEGQSDDATALYTIPFVVTQINDTQHFTMARLINRGTTTGPFYSDDFRVGERLAFLNPNSGAVFAQVLVTAVDVTNQIVTVDQPVTGITTGTTLTATTIYNIDFSTSFLVRNSTYRNSRRYGVWIRAQDGQVLDNTFTGLSDQAITATNDPSWPEGLYSSRVIVQGNTIDACGFSNAYKHNTDPFYAAIDFHETRSLSPNKVTINKAFHSDIKVVGNTILNWRRAAVIVDNTQRVDIRDNTFSAPLSDAAIAADTTVDLHWDLNVVLGPNTYPVLSGSDKNFAQESSTNVRLEINSLALSAAAVAENLPAATPVGDFTSVSLDTAKTYTYALAPGIGAADNAAFLLTSDGHLQTAAAFDFEAQSAYAIRVRTTAQDGLWMERAFTIAVVDLNEPPLCTVSLNTTAPATNDVLTATATKSDPDGNPVNLSFVWRVNGVPRRTFTSATLLSDAFDLGQADCGNAGDAVTVEVTPDDGTLSGPTVGAAATVGASTVAGRFVFYNNTFYDGRDPAAGGSDDAAIDGGKTALRPGQVAMPANYTNYIHGLNGLMIDLQELPAELTPAADDFAFKLGNDSHPAGWANCTTAPTITVRRGAGSGGSDRVELVWPDDALRNTWLQVTVLAGAGTGLAADDVFYFGNARGDTNGDGQTGNPDLVAVFQHQGQVLAAPGPYDVDGSGAVVVADLLAVFRQIGRGATLAMIRPPGDDATEAALLGPGPALPLLDSQYAALSAILATPGDGAASPAVSTSLQPAPATFDAALAATVQWDAVAAEDGVGVIGTGAAPQVLSGGKPRVRGPAACRSVSGPVA